MIKFILKKILSNISIDTLNKLTVNNLINNHYKRILKIKSYNSRDDYLTNIARELDKLNNLIVLEFGVYKGESLKTFSKNISDPSAKFYGFDTFTGLPEKWIDLDKGHFTTSGITPNISDSRISYKVGLFNKTLPKFLEELKTESKLNSNFFIHFDADLFSSTLFILNELKYYIPEYYFSLDEFPSDEIRALNAYELSNDCKIDFLFKQKKDISIPVARVFGKITNQSLLSKIT